MRPKWAFQLLPNEPGVLSKGYRVDPQTQEIEDEVNALLQCRFDFHGISKLVICLGPKKGKEDYSEWQGVAQKQYPNFDIHLYASLNNEDKAAVMHKIILQVFDWLISNFEDASIFKKVRSQLGWAASNA